MAAALFITPPAGAGDSRGQAEIAAQAVHAVAIVVSELPTDFDPGSVARQTVEIEPRHTSSARLEVVRLAQISGRVSVAPGVSPENILIRLLPTDRYTTPDADGAFLFSNVREGDYDIALDRRTLPENTVLQSAERVSVSVRIGAPVPVVEFQTVQEQTVRPVRKIFLKPE